DIDINRVEAARFGLTIADVQEVVKMAIGGMEVGESVEGVERYPINIRYPQETRDSLERLRALPIVTAAGGQVPLGRVAAIRISDGPGVIRSENARRNGWIYVDVAGRDIGSYVRQAQQAVSRAVVLPAGYDI